MNNIATVYIVDDDEAVREGISLLLETAGFTVASHPSGQAFLAALEPDPTGCLILDLRMPDMSGLEVQAELARRQVSLPIIFLSAYGDVPTTARAMRAGAVDFLTKPVNGALLVERVRLALREDQAHRERETARRWFQTRLDRLTQRERQILALALAGLANKEMALRLGISHRTIETHRSRIFLKLRISSLMELIQLASAAGLSLTQTVDYLERGDWPA